MLTRRLPRAAALAGLVLTLTLNGVASAQAAQPGPASDAIPVPVAQPSAPAPDAVLPSGSSPVQQAPAGPNRDVQPVVPTAATPGTGWLEVTALVLLCLVALGLTVVATTTLWWMLHAWHTPATLRGTRFTRVPREPQESFSLLVPARHEQAVLGQTLDQLAALDHPHLEIVAIIGHDDPGTEAVARAAARRHPDLVRVVIDSNVPKNKPKGLNTALPTCTGSVVGVFDAEDEVHPQLLRHVDARFAETGADVVQGGVQLMNIHTSWWALRNVLEYYFWFRSRLHYHASQRFIPLGGNTVFVRTQLLREFGGWDADCLAEDCELGVRLSAAGKIVAVAYDPELATREETPGSIRSLVKQRTRWNQGFLQVLRKGLWRQLPSRRQRLLARYTLAMPFLQALTGVLVPVSLVLVFTAKVPEWVALLTFLPLVPTLVTLAVEASAVGEFCRAYGLRPRLRDYVRLVLGTFPYQFLLAFASVRAVVRQLRGNTAWEKTEHTNAHRVLDDAPAPFPAPVEDDVDVFDLTALTSRRAS